MDKYQLAKQKGIYQIDNRDKKINNYVAIFDIDDTIFNTKTNKLIDSIHELYQYALKNNVYVIFITARDGSGINKDLSIQQLKSLGLSYDLLYFRPPYMDVKKYKKYARKNVIDTGYKPLFSIGDMNWDIGEYGGFGILI
jgi:predicted secreted acid phosphatase